MIRYFVELAYNGSKYHGWQIQPNAISIQAKIEDGLLKALGVKTDIVGAGRTDSGVHASYYVAHFDTDKADIDESGLINKLNRILPNDIVIYSIKKVSNDTHARFDANLRTYNYFVINDKNPFKIDTSYRLRYKLDYDKMNQASKILFEYNDFTSFSKLHTEVANNLCTIHRAEWLHVDDQWVFIISANRFLRNMVRAIVGTLLDVGKGKINLDGFRTVIEQKDRGKAGLSVPANALFLTDIQYPNHLFKSELKRKLL